MSEEVQVPESKARLMRAVEKVLMLVPPPWRDEAAQWLVELVKADREAR